MQLRFTEQPLTMSAGPIKLAVVDDHPMVRSGIAIGAAGASPVSDVAGAKAA